MNSNIRSAYPDPEDPESYRVTWWRLGEIPPKAWIYPKEPAWWRDDDAEERRRLVVDQFSDDDLGTLIDEVNFAFRGDLGELENLTSLMRRYWSLRFFTEIGRLQLMDSDKIGFEQMASKCQLESARYLADSAWRHIMTLPALTVDKAIREALVTPYEIDEDEFIE